MNADNQREVERFIAAARIREEAQTALWPRAKEIVAVVEPYAEGRSDSYELEIEADTTSVGYSDRCGDHDHVTFPTEWLWRDDWRDIHAAAQAEKMRRVEEARARVESERREARRKQFEALRKEFE